MRLKNKGIPSGTGKKVRGALEGLVSIPSKKRAPMNSFMCSVAQ